MWPFSGGFAPEKGKKSAGSVLPAQKYRIKLRAARSGQRPARVLRGRATLSYALDIFVRLRRAIIIGARRKF